MNNELNTTKTTRQTSKNEVMLQVFLPLIITILLFVVIAVFVTLDTSPSSSNIHHWANISVVFLSIPLIICTFLNIAFFGVLIFGLNKAIRGLPFPLQKVHLFLLRISLWLWQISERMTSPVISLRSKAHSFRTVRFFRKNNLLK